jgi:predicted metal-dependent enzyme (double-stranded beta helix superfamily)
MSSEYSARECAHEVTESIVAAKGDLEQVGRDVVAPMQRLMDRPDLLTLGVERTAVHGDLARYLYYDGQLMIIVSQFHKGAVIPVHDHGTWEAVGIYRGKMEHTLYRETGGGSRPGDAPLEVVETSVLSPFDVRSAIPPKTEIHGFTALSEDTMLLVVVGGQYKPVRRYFHVDDGTYFERGERAFRAGRG